MQPAACMALCPQVLAVEGNRLVLGGADIVDGSPVLDIKPYVPFCDALPGARAPDWVQVGRRQGALRAWLVTGMDGASGRVGAHPASSPHPPGQASEAQPDKYPGVSNCASPMPLHRRRRAMSHCT